MTKAKQELIGQIGQLQEDLKSYSDSCTKLLNEINKQHGDIEYSAQDMQEILDLGRTEVIALYEHRFLPLEQAAGTLECLDSQEMVQLQMDITVLGAFWKQLFLTKDNVANLNALIDAVWTACPTEGAEALIGDETVAEMAQALSGNDEQWAQWQTENATLFAKLQRRYIHIYCLLKNALGCDEHPEEYQFLNRFAQFICKDPAAIEMEIRKNTEVIRRAAQTTIESLQESVVDEESLTEEARDTYDSAITQCALLAQVQLTQFDEEKIVMCVAVAQLGVLFKELYDTASDSANMSALLQLAQGPILAPQDLETIVSAIRNGSHEGLAPETRADMVSLARYAPTMKAILSAAPRQDAFPNERQFLKQAIAFFEQEAEVAKPQPAPPPEGTLQKVQRIMLAILTAIAGVLCCCMACRPRSGETNVRNTAPQSAVNVDGADVIPDAHRGSERER